MLGGRHAWRRSGGSLALTTTLPWAPFCHLAVPDLYLLQQPGNNKKSGFLHSAGHSRELTNVRMRSRSLRICSGPQRNVRRLPPAHPHPICCWHLTCGQSRGTEPYTVASELNSGEFLVRTELNCRPATQLVLES